jgi:hypothetical protein
MSRTARRAQWLFPVTREVYRTGRATTEGECIRCGGLVRPGAHGMRAGVTLRVRDRGTRHAHEHTEAIHCGCVPTADYERRGIPPSHRRLSA